MTTAGDLNRSWARARPHFTQVQAAAMTLEQCEQRLREYFGQVLPQASAAGFVLPEDYRQFLAAAGASDWSAAKLRRRWDVWLNGMSTAVSSTMHHGAIGARGELASRSPWVRIASFGDHHALYLRCDGSGDVGHFEDRHPWSHGAPDHRYASFSAWLDELVRD